MTINHNETLKVRTALKAGRMKLREDNHNEALKVRTEREQPAISMRKQIRWTGNKQDRLELLVVRAGLRAGRRKAARAD